MPNIRHFKLSNSKIIFLMNKGNMFNLTAGNGSSKIRGTEPAPKILTPGLYGSNQIIALCIILVFTLPALAQDQAGEAIEEITVIGSHIKMDPEEALVPVTSIDREELRYQMVRGCLGQRGLGTRPILRSGRAVAGRTGI